jgi:copper chaperone
MKGSIWNGVAAAFAIVFAVAFGPLIVRELRTLPHPRALAQRASARIVTLEVGGMTCSGCAAAVRGQLEDVPGVSAVEVRLDQQRAMIVCDRAVADTALFAAVQRAGPGFTAVTALR